MKTTKRKNITQKSLTRKRGRLHNSNSNKVDYAILSAAPEELTFIDESFAENQYNSVKAAGFNFKIYTYKNKKILVTTVGLGTTFAASVIALIDSYFNPEYFFFTGTAGGIKNGLKLCDVVIAEKAFEAEIQGAFVILKNTPFENALYHPLKNEHFPEIYAADEELLAIAKSVNLENITVHQGTVVSSNAFPAPAALFAAIKNRDPYCIDMETSALYQYAWLCKKKVIAFRGISNLLDTDGRDNNIHNSNTEGSAKASAMLLLATLDRLIATQNAATEKEVNIE
jgi:5'-methylthioadenosine/S-adenosylhomocysteine nucleosidase